MRKILTVLSILLSAVPILSAEGTTRDVTFRYDGKAFSADNWEKTVTAVDYETSMVEYISPDGRLKCSLLIREYSDFPVVETRPYLECISSDSTAFIDDFVSLHLTRPHTSRSVRVRRVTGSLSSYTDFCHQDVLLQGRHECDYVKMSCFEGRSSAWLPYFGVDFDSDSGIEVAIGWTGTWAVEMRYADRFCLDLGIGEKTHFRLAPGEKFMMPYTVIYEREGRTVEEGLAGIHRFIIKHKSPTDAEGNLLQPLLPLTGSGGNKTDANLLTIIDKGTSTFSNIPFNTFWVDAGWYGAPHEVDQQTNCGPYWFKWAGYWNPNTWAHPDGNLKKVAGAAHRKGMKFLLWFEPERATEYAPIVAEHPEYFHRRKDSSDSLRYLLDMGNPDARAWILDEVSRNIRESGVDIYRQDFNMNPLPIWLDNDAPDRMGIAEISHINGLYAYLDELHRRFPDLMFENCAGGGTRMDIEMMSRSHSYCRDDAHMYPHPEELTQNITLNSTPYIPFTGGETFQVELFDTYAWLSCIGAGTVFTPTDFDGMFLRRVPGKEEVEWFAQMLDVSARVRTLFQGDFYALTDNSSDGSDIFCGYQLNNPETGEGFYLIFRRAECPESEFYLRLRGIEPESSYTVENFGGGTCVAAGKELSMKILSFPEPRSYRLVFYKKCK